MENYVETRNCFDQARMLNSTTLSYHTAIEFQLHNEIHGCLKPHSHCRWAVPTASYGLSQHTIHFVMTCTLLVSFF